MGEHTRSGGSNATVLGETTIKQHKGGCTHEHRKQTAARHMTEHRVSSAVFMDLDNDSRSHKCPTPLADISEQKLIG